MAVVDASIVVDWIAPGRDPDSVAAGVLRRLIRDGAPVVAPALMPQEVANALLTGVRRRRWSAAAADASFRLLRALPMDLDQTPDLTRSWDLSRRYDEHPIYDMVYLELARRREEILVTADRRLLIATGPAAGVMTAADWLAT